MQEEEMHSSPLYHNSPQRMFPFRSRIAVWGNPISFRRRCATIYAIIFLRARAMATSFKNNRRLDKVGLLILILLATALRFYRLGWQDIWGDEAFSIFLSKMSLPPVIAGAADTHPPFSPLLLFLWLRLVGDSAFATRALSVLIGILIVPLIFVFAKRVSAPRARVAWFAAILAISTSAATAT